MEYLFQQLRFWGLISEELCEYSPCRGDVYVQGAYLKKSGVLKYSHRGQKCLIFCSVFTSAFEKSESV